MQTRRDFLKTATVLGSSSLVWGLIPEALARAYEINPEDGSTWADAEHVVILMQENRSFDHAYGSLSGVRGFRDTRVHIQPNGRKVWFQSEKNGTTYPPFRLDMENTNVSWIGGTSHTWGDQLGARNGGQYDNWLPAKHRNDMPMTLGFFTREDIPFYYALADAFTICDQAFCSTLTGTHPNRVHLWTGTNRASLDDNPKVYNDEIEAGLSWKAFPERLQGSKVDWRIYQNELTVGTGLTGEHSAWLSNFGCNTLEYFHQFQVNFAPQRRSYVAARIEALPAEIEAEEKALASANLSSDDMKKRTAALQAKKKSLTSLQREAEAYTEAKWMALSPEARELHERAFTTNKNLPEYRDLVEHTYDDAGTERKINVPRGDVLHQFRADVDAGKLPTVSWLVAPEHFTDHPASAWFGAYFVSEVLAILTKNPEVWKKTIFILCYDENDGYFDHVPPFTAPHPGKPETGKASPSIDTSLEIGDTRGHVSSMGLGFRCPLVIASPWSRGGCVNSQVFDHTSVIMFLEKWLAGKGKSVHEPNINPWRRSVCGDLTSVFRPYKGETYRLPKAVVRDTYIERIHKAKFKNRPEPATPLDEESLKAFDIGAFQEHGTRPSCPLPYEIEANLEHRGGQIHVRMECGSTRLKDRAVGCAFNGYSYASTMECRAYAVAAKSIVEDAYEVGSTYNVRIDGPNGFTRGLSGSDNPEFRASIVQGKDEIVLTLTNLSAGSLAIAIDPGYGQKARSISLRGSQTQVLRVSTGAGKGWYDVSLQTPKTRYHFAGRIENGQWGVTDPAMA